MNEFEREIKIDEEVEKNIFLRRMKEELPTKVKQNLGLEKKSAIIAVTWNDLRALESSGVIKDIGD